MLLIREVARLVRDLFAFAVGTRRWTVLIVFVLVAAIILLSFTVTTLAPIAIYPFL